MNKIKLLCFSIVLCSVISGYAQQEHPFMIIKKEMYPDFIKKTQEHKMTFMASRAAREWEKGDLNYNLIRYIVDGDNKQQYVNKILSTIYKMEDAELNPRSHSYVGHASKFFMAIIAVDVVYNDLTTLQLERVENIFERYGDFYKKNAGAGWALSRFGINTVYAIYKGNEEEITYWRNKYEARLFDRSMMKDGSWGHSSGYAFFRMHHRISKSGVIDVLNFTGRANYYDDTRMQKFQEWSFTFGLTPASGQTMFGDTGHTNNHLAQISKVFFASNYGTNIKGLVDYHVTTPASFVGNSFLIYALRESNYKRQAKMPTSLLKEHSGAALWGKTGARNALQGILHNLKPNLPNVDQFGHAKQETNSLGIFAYGQHLLMNSGYIGFGASTPDGTNLRSAHVNNTVLIGDKTRHSTNYGNGLIDGVVGGNIEFATADAGPAIQNGSHKRTLHLVHSIPQKSNGYFVIHDEVKPNDIKDKVSINFQTNTKHKDTKLIIKNQEYQSPINGHVINQVAEGTNKVTLFFASQPNEVSIDKSVKGSFHYPYIESDNVKPQYQAGTDGYVRATTVIFPEDPDHQKPEISKISSASYSGAKIIHSTNFVDHYLGGNPATTNTFESTIKFTASTTFFRKESGKTTAYAATNAIEFIDTETIAYGYNASAPVSLEMENGSGFINAKENTFVKFYLKNVSKIKIDDTFVVPSESGSNYIQALIPTGRHTIKLITEATDLNKPIISFLKPIKNRYNIGDNLTVLAKASVEVGTIKKVSLYFDGKFVRPSNHNRREWWSKYDPLMRNLQAGKHTLKLVTTASNGATAEATKTILVGTPPSVTFKRPETTYYKTGQNITIDAVASDKEGTVKKVELYFDGKFVKPSTYNPRQWWHKYDPLMARLKAGKHILKLVATDNTGMTSEATKIIFVGNPPSVSFIKPTVTNYGVGKSLNVVAEAEDTDGLIANVDLFFDGKYVNRANGRQWWSKYDPLMGNLKAGKHTLKLVAKDNIGMSAETSMTIFVGTPPQVSFARPTRNTFKVGENLGVLADVSDAEDNFKKVELFFDDKPVKSSPVNKKEWWHKYDPLMRNLQAGKHTLKLVATDDFGMSAEASMTILVGSPPTVSFARPTKDTFRVGDDFSVLADVADAENNFKRVDLYFDGKFVNPSTYNPREWWSKYDALMRNLQAGKHTLKLVAIDDFGMSAEASMTILVGSPPKVSFARPAAEATFRVGADLGVLADVSDAEDNFKRVDLYFDGKFVKPSTYNPIEWWHKYDPLMRNLQAGEHTLRLVATDDLGMSAEAIMTIFVGNSRVKALLQPFQIPITIYPNPVVGDGFTIDIGNASKSVSYIRISDALGRTVHQTKTNDKSIFINRVQLREAGVYFVKITQNKSILVQKILLE